MTILLINLLTVLGLFAGGPLIDLCNSALRGSFSIVHRCLLLISFAALPACSGRAFITGSVIPNFSNYVTIGKVATP